MANPLDFLKSTNYPSSFLEGTFGDKFYKSVVEPAKLGTGPKPTIGQVAKNWNPLKAFTPQMLATGPTKAASTFLKSSGIGTLASLLFNPTVANAAEIGMTPQDFQNLALQNQSKNLPPYGPGAHLLDYDDLRNRTGPEELQELPPYGPGAHLLDYDDLRNRTGTPRIQRFKQQQLMNRRKQQMQQTIRQHEAAAAAKQKAAADAAAERQAALQAQVTAQANREARRRVSQGEARDYGKTETRASSGWESSPFAKGGLADLYRYGGFSG